MQDVLIFKSQDFDWLSGYWNSKSCPWSTWTNINFNFKQTLIRSRDIEDWLICKCNFSIAFSHIHSKSVGYAIHFIDAYLLPENQSQISMHSRDIQDRLAESISGDIHQTYSNLTSSACSPHCCLSRC